LLESVAFPRNSGISNRPMTFGRSQKTWSMSCSSKAASTRLSRA
jgi:hypothetical protein